MAPRSGYLPLLPSGPDGVHSFLPHRARSSIPPDKRQSHKTSGLGREFSPAIADFGYRAPLTPRLARPKANVRLAPLSCQLRTTKNLGAPPNPGRRISPAPLCTLLGFRDLGFGLTPMGLRSARPIVAVEPRAFGLDSSSQEEPSHLFGVKRSAVAREQGLRRVFQHLPDAGLDLLRILHPQGIGRLPGSVEPPHHQIADDGGVPREDYGNRPLRCARASESTSPRFRSPTGLPHLPPASYPAQRARL